MTTITFITLNATIGAVVVAGLHRLLAHGITSGRQVVEAEIRSLPGLESESIAA
jgi:hypothetical protein